MGKSLHVIVLTVWLGCSVAVFGETSTNSNELLQLVQSFENLFSEIEQSREAAIRALSGKVMENSSKLGDINQLVTQLEAAANQMVSDVEEIKNIPLRDVPIGVSRGGKHVYWYQSGGLALSGSQAVVTGYGTAQWGYWAILGGTLAKAVLQSTSTRNSTVCGSNEIAIGVVTNGTLRCARLKSYFRIINRSTHQGPWGFHLTQYCPSGKVMLSWALHPNGRTTYQCGQVAQLTRFKI